MREIYLLLPSFSIPDTPIFNHTVTVCTKSIKGGTYAIGRNTFYNRHSPCNCRHHTQKIVDDTLSSNHHGLTYLHPRPANNTTYNSQLPPAAQSKTFKQAHQQKKETIMSALYPLTNEELYKQAPTLFTQQPHYEVSDKYHFIPTIVSTAELNSAVFS